MTPQQLLEFLRATGIEIVCENDNLKVRSTRSKITDEQKTLISTNKSALLAHLMKPQDKPDSDFADLSGEVSNSLPVGNQLPAESAGAFKEYKLPNGETQRFTKDEFDRVVDLFRLLHQQSQKLGQNNGVT